MIWCRQLVPEAHQGAERLATELLHQWLGDAKDNSYRRGAPGAGHSATAGVEQSDPRSGNRSTNRFMNEGFISALAWQWAWMITCAARGLKRNAAGS